MKRREMEFLLCCARTQLDPQAVERIHSLARRDTDWDYLVRTAIRHRVIPLLYRSLKKGCPQAVPDGTLEQLRRYFLVNAGRNLFLSDRLLKILSLLKDRGIFAIPFKGPVLAEYVYGDVALRQFADLDILVHKRDVLKARKLLISDGYRSEFELNTEQDKAYVRTEYYSKLITDDGRVIVDLHWEMTGRNSCLPFDLEHVKGRLEPGTLAGKEVLHLSPEDLLLYLCLHGSKDCWPNLESICSVAELIRSCPAMDWPRVAHLASRMRCERILFLGLFLAGDLLGAPLPGEILKRMESDRKIPRLAMKVYKNLFDESHETSANGINPRFSLFHMEVRDRLSAKIRYGLYLAISPTVEDWRRLPLPASLSFLHYAFRPIRLAVGLGLALLRRYLPRSCLPRLPRR